MADLNISAHIHKDVVQNHCFNNVDLSETVLNFKKVLCSDLQLNEIELIYKGACLENSNTLSSYGVSSGAKLYVLRKHVTTPAESIMDADIERSVLLAVKATLSKRANFDTITTILNDPVQLQSVIEASPGLESDPIALSALRDPSLLADLCKPQHINKMLQQHPSFGHACLYLASEVQAQLLSAAAAPTKTTGTYSLDELSDEEEEHLSQQRVSQEDGVSPITTSQLMAALSAAQRGATPSTPTPRSLLTRSHLSDAMRIAQMSTASPLTTPSTPATSDLQTQLSQLRDMGITDESVARAALEATNGDLESALEIIFGHTDH